MIEITNRNIKRYTKLHSDKIEVGKTYAFKQGDVPTASRIVVKCECDVCKTLFFRKRVDVKTATYCSKNCRNVHMKSNNPNPPVDYVDVACEVCCEKFKVNPAKYKKQSYFLCSRACYATHRSNTYSGDKVYNYQNIIVPCAYCEIDTKTTESELKLKKNIFCSTKCYYSHRAENFSEYTTHALNNSRSETVPETRVREYLEKKGISFIQEHPLENTYYADFYLPDYEAILEVYGDYWHVNPRVYGEETGMRKITELQKSFIRRDNRRNGHLRHLGYDLFFIWEKQIKDNLDYYMGIIIDEIINKHESATTTRRTPWDKTRVKI